MARTATAGIMVVLGALVACGGGRPDGELLSDPVEITAAASVDGVPLLPGGATNSIQILIEGSMTTVHGIESSTYSWNGAGPIPLELNNDGAFSVNLDLVAGEGTLVLEGTPLIEGEPSTLSMSFYLDVTSPTLTAPDVSFAAEIRGESEMNIDKEPTSFTLSGGTPVPVVDGVSYSKYSTTYAAGYGNLPVWRFKLEDDRPLDDAVLLFRVALDTVEVVAWTEATQADDGIFEITITSDLSETFTTTSGEYTLEVQAFDGATNAAEIVRLGWTQSILNPPIYIATGSEDVMGTPLGPRDPRSYALGINFSDMRSQSGLIIGSLVLGNPNDVPVLVKLETTAFEPRSAWGWWRGEMTFGQDVAGPINACGPDGNGTTYFSYDNPGEYCQGRPANAQFRQPPLSDVANILPSFEVRSVAGDVLSTQPVFTIPGNTVVHVMATLASPPSNLPANTFDRAVWGFYATDRTVEAFDPFYYCTAPSLGCANWTLYRDYRGFDQFYAEWPFSARTFSKVNFDLNDSTEWREANLDAVDGYSRVHATGDDALDVPVDINDIDGAIYYP